MDVGMEIHFIHFRAYLPADCEPKPPIFKRPWFTR